MARGSSSGVAAAPKPENPFYGPANQFWPHRIIWAIIKGLFMSVLNTLIGLCYFVIHPIKSVKGIYFALRHPASTLRGIAQRMRLSLQNNGIFYTATCAVCMFILPGAGLFGKVAELSEHGRKASRMRPTAAQGQTAQGQTAQGQTAQPQAPAAQQTYPQAQPEPMAAATAGGGQPSHPVASSYPTFRQSASPPRASAYPQVAAPSV